MSPVDFKKWPCHPVEFRGQGPRNRAFAMSMTQVYLNCGHIERKLWGWHS